MNDTRTQLTETSWKLFEALAGDAADWDGTPVWDYGHDRKLCGNLTDLKKKGLVATSVEEGTEWVHFTELGAALAQDELGHTIPVTA